MDASQLPELTDRQEKILTHIIRAYTEKPEPVSSQHVVDHSDLSVSSATIRNEMVVLEELGYIRAPHKSAGRVPTENGYRYFVQRIIDQHDLMQGEQRRIESKLQTLPMATDAWMRLAATLVARTAQTASLVTPPVSRTNRFKHVELVSIQGRLVLMILVLHGGVVHQRMLNLAEVVTQAKLTEAASRINTICRDLYAHDIQLKAVQLPLLEREVAELASELMESADNSHLRVFRDGLSDIINTFQDGEGAQQAIRVFEERAFLDMILADVLNPTADDFKVIVAGDGREELNQLSIVISRYGIPGHMIGAVGVLGPTHINYGRAIQTVRYVSGLMTSMLHELYSDDDILGE
jgi:heat-inducible transcriptional repressor